jgi:hypothetical protein
MSFSPITPGNVNTPPMVQRTQLRMVQGGSLLDKPTFGEKFMLGLKKFGAVFGRMAASVLRFFPGLGTVASSALYGISNLSEMSYQKQVAKRMDQLAIDEASAQTNYNLLTPGFGMFGSPGGTMPPDVNDGLGADKLNTVLTREMAARTEIENFSIPS